VTSDNVVGTDSGKLFRTYYYYYYYYYYYDCDYYYYYIVSERLTNYPIFSYESTAVKFGIQYRDTWLLNARIIYHLA